MNLNEPDYLCNGHYLKKTWCPQTRRTSYGFHEVYQDENGELIVPLGIRHHKCPDKKRVMIIYKYVYPTHHSLGSRDRYLVPCSTEDGSLRYAKVFMGDGKCGKLNPKVIGNEYHYSLANFMRLDPHEEFAMINASKEGEYQLETMTNTSLGISNNLIGSHYSTLSNEYKKTFSQPQLEHQHYSNVQGSGGSGTQMLMPSWQQSLNFDVDSSLIGAIYEVSPENSKSFIFPAQVLTDPIRATIKTSKKKPTKKNPVIKQAKTVASGKSAGGKRSSTKKPSAPPNEKITKRPAEVGVLDKNGKLSSKNEKAAKNELGNKARAVKSSGNKTERLQGAPTPSKTSRLGKGVRLLKKGAGKIARSQFASATKEIVTQAATAAAVTATQSVIDKTSNQLNKFGKKIVARSPMSSTVDKTPSSEKLSTNESQEDTQTTEDSVTAQDGEENTISSTFDNDYDDEPLYVGNQLPIVTDTPATNTTARQFGLSLGTTAYGNENLGIYALLHDGTPHWSESLERLGCDCNKKRKQPYPKGSRTWEISPGTQAVGQETVDIKQASKPLKANDVAVSNVPASKTTDNSPPSSDVQPSSPQGNDTTEETDDLGDQSGDNYSENENVPSSTSGIIPTTVPGLYTFTYVRTREDGALVISYGPKEIKEMLIGVETGQPPDGEDDNEEPQPLTQPMVSGASQPMMVTPVVQTPTVVPVTSNPTPQVQPMLVAPVPQSMVVLQQPVQPNVVPIPQQYVYGHGNQGVCRTNCRRSCWRPRNYMKPLAPLVCDMNSASPPACHTDLHELPYTVNANHWMLSPVAVVHNICGSVRKHFREWCLHITASVGVHRGHSH